MWKIISEDRRTDDGVDYTAYGVRSSTYCIADICCARETIVRFARLLNEYGASAVNAVDIAEDFLAGGFEGSEEALAVTA